MLSRIKFKNLFGIFNYDIHLKDGGVTILTGPNGFGKSTILKSINAFYLFDIIFFSNIDFEEILFYSDEFEEPIQIKKNDSEIILDKYPIDIKTFKNKLLKVTKRPNFIRLDEEKWINSRTGEFFTKDEMLELFINDSILEYSREFESIQIKNIMNKMKKYSGETKFIKEQRILKEDKLNSSENKTIKIIDELPDKLKEKMNKVSSEYSSKANKLDSSYPNRLFKTDKGISEEEYESAIISMNKKFEKLNKYNISDIKKFEVKDIPEKNNFLKENSKALKIYFDDFEKKYEVFEDFIEQLDLFTGIINSRLKFKKIKISRENGIVVLKSNNNEPLPLDKLSSGEKQEIILFYELIFETEKNVHLLIDEPEISLHIEWQLKFMDDLLKIAERKKFKVTVATHSPQIISNHWDIQLDLGELYGN